MNTITVTGNLGKDAELKTFGENSVFEFSVAVNGASDKKDENNDKFYASAWFRVKFWTKNPERFESALVKGTSLLVVGQLKESKWTNDEGVEKVSYFINANEVVPTQKLTGGGESAAAAPAMAAKSSSKKEKDLTDPFAD